MATLATKIKTGDIALMSDVRLLVSSFSATVVKPLAPISIREDNVICMRKFFQPIHLRFLVKINIVKRINDASNWRSPATNQGGTVSTPILIPKNVVPQTTATKKIAMMILELNTQKIKHKGILKTLILVINLYLWTSNKM